MAPRHLSTGSPVAASTMVKSSFLQHDPLAPTHTTDAQRLFAEYDRQRLRARHAVVHPHGRADGLERAAHGVEHVEETHGGCE